MKVINKVNDSYHKKPKILVAPLDWGLGHATRCILIIRDLISVGCEVVIAAEKNQKKLLELEFPDIRFVKLRGYHLKYSKSRILTLLRILFQIPKILIRIKLENRWLRKLLRSEHFDAVIADNRYGLYAPQLLSIFITHQLCIKTPFGKTVERKLQQFNYYFIDRFNSCWVPDAAIGNSLAGELSHPTRLPQTRVEYIGILSRFEKQAAPVITIDLLILLSGPEPQRSIFENILMEQLRIFKGKAVLIRGLPGQQKIPQTSFPIEIHNHLDAEALNSLLCSSALVVSRPGYSTVMDIVTLGKKSILVPTPGQTEQEYLGDYLQKNTIACSMHQDTFQLQDALAKAKDFLFVTYDVTDHALLDTAIAGLVSSMKYRV